MNKIKFTVAMLFMFCGFAFAESKIDSQYKSKEIGGLVWFMKELSGGQGYTWEQAERACPEGWRLPSKLEWENLNASLLEGDLFIDEFIGLGNVRYWWSSQRIGRRYLAYLCSATGDKIMCNETDISSQYAVRCVKSK